jgi:hypothetical protein
MLRYAFLFLGLTFSPLFAGIDSVEHCLLYIAKFTIREGACKENGDNRYPPRLWGCTYLLFWDKPK